MPRTPAPLTVEQKDGGYWNVADADGNWKGSFDTAADARAFVALPALMDAAREAYFILEVLEPDHPINDQLQAALAQADGPKEQP